MLASGINFEEWRGISISSIERFITLAIMALETGVAGA